MYINCKMRFVSRRNKNNLSPAFSKCLLKYDEYNFINSAVKLMRTYPASKMVWPYMSEVIDGDTSLRLFLLIRFFQSLNKIQPKGFCIVCQSSKHQVIESACCSASYCKRCLLHMLHNVNISKKCIAECLHCRYKRARIFPITRPLIHAALRTCRIKLPRSFKNVLMFLQFLSAPHVRAYI